ncbi:hypothetical protein L873DRAFT_1791833 [Choiromyces venosus 120613-1]|uniref:Uncharacterized protein n=1 Tax=Choiromyces venosus 120613-1 TaxID=1336337 RepID=A0A3N4JQD3_9PEZI|nr:hypothetical protein L873DRAFT_1791833 [Choiromyces venosus 120613-1]
MLEERINGSSAIADGGEVITSQSAGDGEEWVVEIDSRSDHDGPDPNFPDLEDRGAHSSADPSEWECLSDSEDSHSSYRDCQLPATEHFSSPPVSSQLPPRISVMTTDIHPDNSRSTFAFVLDRYLIISSFIGLLAFLIYVLLWLPSTYSFHDY